MINRINCSFLIMSILFILSKMFVGCVIIKQ
jgi:hypothetical protein